MSPRAELSTKDSNLLATPFELANGKLKNSNPSAVRGDTDREGMFPDIIAQPYGLIGELAEDLSILDEFSKKTLRAKQRVKQIRREQ